MRLHPIRPARSGDGVGIARLLADHARFDELDADPVVAGGRIEALIPEVEDPNRTMLVAEDGVGGLAGYVHWTVTHPAFLAGPSLYVTELFVAAAVRGQGHGTRLLDLVHEQASALGASRVELLQVRGTTAHERGYYPARGYVHVTHLEAYRRTGDVRPVRHP